MAPLDGGVLPPVSDDLPAGEDLEYDPQFNELERTAQGKPEVQYGNTVEAAVPPDWKETAQLAEQLLERTHDLRVLVHLATAKLHLDDGIAGFAQVLTSIQTELDSRWDHVHPKLDPEEDNDPMQRANALSNLKHPVRILRRLREIPLAGTRNKGLICWRDIAVMSGAMEAEAGQAAVTEAAVLGAFTDTERPRIEALEAALASLLVSVPAIPAAFTKHSGPATGPDLDHLLKLVRDMSRDVSRFAAMARANAGEDEAAEAPAPGDGDAPAEAGAAAAPGRAAPRFASIQAIQALTKREDALHALELASAYFRTQEPSSPLPLLIDRAKRLAGMPFMDILRDLAPDGLSQAQLVAGSINE